MSIQNKMKMLKIIRVGVLALLTMLLVLSFHDITIEGTQQPQNDGVFIIRSDDYGIILELITSSFKAEEKSVDNVTYQEIKLPYTHGEALEPGKPQVPVKGVLLGTPYNANIKVKVLDCDAEILSGYNLYPAPKVHKSEDELSEDGRKKRLRQLRYRPFIRVNVKPHFSKDDDAYSRRKFYPDVMAEISPLGSLRAQNVAKLKLYPVQFNPGTGKLRFCKRIRVEVDFGRPAEVDWERDSQTPQEFKKLGKELLHNYDDTRWWKCRETKPKPRPLSTGLVSEPLPVSIPPQVSYKILVDEDGIYRLTWEDLAGAGLNLYDLDPRTIKIFNQGKEIQSYVQGENDNSFDTEDYIEFYGKAIDTRFTSTNVYWLTIDGEQGLRMKRMKKIKNIKEETVITPLNFLSIHHLERNEMYWMELPDRDFIDDHWFFNDILWDGASKSFTLPLRDVAVIENKSKVELSLQGLSYSPSAIDHHSRIYLNNNLIDDAAWATAGEYKLEKDVPQSYLKNGDNIITVQLPGDTGAPFELVLVNWFRISFWREFKAEEDCLKFNHRGEGLYLYKISNFTKDDIEIFDITEPDEVKKAANFNSEIEGSTYTVSFKDILTGDRVKEYLILASDKAKKPVSINKDISSNLTAYENGADYIIITHEDFYDSILPLSRRYTSEGIRVSVVKVQDIYDEFNHGIFHPDAIKDFLTHVYNNWIKPAPAYVLLVGDGTYDYRDYGGFGVKNYVPTYMVHSLDFGETGSDNWFVCLDGEDDILPDMFIGRFPVKKAEEVEVLVNKTINYDR